MSNTAIAKRILVELTQEEEMFRAIDRVRKNGDAIHARVRTRVAQQVRDIVHRYTEPSETNGPETNGHSEAVTESVNG